MPVVRFAAADLLRLLGKDVPKEQLVATIPQLGADIDDVAGDTWAIEFFPDRPDLYTVEGVARALRAYLGLAPGLARYDVAPAKHAVKVDVSVAGVRPHIAGAFVRDVPMTERMLEGLIALQEDLHWGLGARRRKVAIGVHDARALAPPFTYKVVGPHAVRFVPLAETREMDPAGILADHPKGRDYAHLVRDGAFPLIVDAKGQVLSLPPIINGALTTVTANSRDLFLDVTGTDAWAVDRALNILATSLAEAGGKLEAVRVEPVGGVARATPDLAPERRALAVEDANRLLGSSFAPEEVAAKLERMGFGATAASHMVMVDVPPYRVDILHDVDLIEDVAIGHGIMDFEHAPLASVTTGTTLAASVAAEKARQALVGQGFLEVMTLNLTSDEQQFARMGEEPGDAVRVKNPATSEHAVLRVRLVPNLLNVLSKNTHRDLPQSVFEVGVVTLVGPDGSMRPVRRVAGVVVSAKAGFSDAKGIVGALARDLGWTKGAPLAVEPADAAWLVPGRAAKLVGRAGAFGEVHPRTLQAFGIGYPAVAFEFDL